LLVSARAGTLFGATAAVLAAAIALTGMLAATNSPQPARTQARSVTAGDTRASSGTKPGGMAIMGMRGPGVHAAGKKGSAAKGARRKGDRGPGASAGEGMVGPGSADAGYRFTTLDDPAGAAFNQLLGINDRGRIAGYFGSGAAGQPNMGYLLSPPYAQPQYQAMNYPGSAQTQLTGLNAEGVQVGFWSGQNNANQSQNATSGFYIENGAYHDVAFPTTNNSSPPMDQLLGVNDHEVAVGFYVDGQGRSRGYEYNLATGQFTRVLEPGAAGGSAGPSLTAAAINNGGDVAGYYTATGGITDAFLETAAGRFTTLAVPGASATMALGVSNSDEVVGGYSMGTGSAAVMHGFSWTPQHGFATIDDPDGAQGTTVNGVNDLGDLVGFYTDSRGVTHGMLASPRS
jgi:hypothetical protein